MARTQAQRIADRAARREAEGKEATRRQQEATAPTPRPGSVAANRAAGTNKAAVNKAAKENNTVRPDSVAANRAAAKEKAQSMKQYKAENNINKTDTRKKDERKLEARQQREGSVAYNRANPGGNEQEDGNTNNAFTSQMEAYNAKLQGGYDKALASADPSAMPGTLKGGYDPSKQGFDEDGYLRYNSGGVMWQDKEMLKNMGIKEGDMLYRPGSRDELNGRILTGRVRITDSGAYIPEYENEMPNSAFQGSGSSQTKANLRDGSWQKQNSGSSGGGGDQMYAGGSQNFDETSGGQTDYHQPEMDNDYTQTNAEQYQQQQMQGQNGINFDISQFMPSRGGGSKFKAYSYNPMRFNSQGQ